METLVVAPKTLLEFGGVGLGLGILLLVVHSGGTAKALNAQIRLDSSKARARWSEHILGHRESYPLYA